MYEDKVTGRTLQGYIPDAIDVVESGARGNSEFIFASELVEVAVLGYRAIDAWGNADFIRTGFTAMRAFLDSGWALFLSFVWLFVIALGWHKTAIRQVSRFLRTHRPKRSCE
mgnify:CR=1 FL=1